MFLIVVNHFISLVIKSLTAIILYLQQMATVPPWPNPQTISTSDSVPSVSTSDGTNDSEGAGDDDGSNDAEGVWSPDIEQSFQVRFYVSGHHTKTHLYVLYVTYFMLCRKH